MNIPEIHCPLPSARSPFAEVAEDHVAEWAERFRLGDTGLALAANRVGNLSAYVHPRASADVVKVGATWTAWLFAYDDLLVESVASGDSGRLREAAQAQARILAALGAMSPGPAPEPGDIVAALTASLRDVVSSVLRLRPGWDAGPFADDLRRFFQANLWEIANTAHGRRPKLGAYLTMRRHTSAYFPSYRVSAALAGVQLPPEVWGHVAVRGLETMACNYGSWLNDVYSFERERAEGCVHGLVPILQEEYGYGPHEAVDRVADLCRIEVESYLELKSRLPDLGLDLNGDLGRYLDLLESWMSGSLAWYRMSPRYNRAVQVPVLERR